VAVLQEFKVLDMEFAKVILGAAVIDDILSLLVLSLVKNIPSGGIDAAVMNSFLAVLATAFIYVAGGILIGQYLVKSCSPGQTAEKNCPRQPSSASSYTSSHIPTWQR